MIRVPSYSCLCPIYWSHVLSRKWRCSWSSADRRCSNYMYIWVINDLIAKLGATYIRDLTVSRLGLKREWSKLCAWCIPPSPYLSQLPIRPYGAYGTLNYDFKFPIVKRQCIWKCIILFTNNWHHVWYVAKRFFRWIVGKGISAWLNSPFLFPVPLRQSMRRCACNMAQFFFLWYLVDVYMVLSRQSLQEGSRPMSNGSQTAFLNA